MSNLLKKAKANPEKKNAKYEFLNLSENPFPNVPFVNKINPDKRYNGSIYESAIREKEHQQIFNNFIEIPQSDSNHIRLGYIQDFSFVGRGNGKSAFTLNLIEEINAEYCLDISNGQNKCFGLHLSPEPSGRTKTFNSFVDLIFSSILEKGIIKYCLTSLRLSSINKHYPEINFKNLDDEKIIENLNLLTWYKEKKIEISKITNSIYEDENMNKTGNNLPLYRDKNQFYATSIVKEEDFKKYYETLKKGKDRFDFIFNDLVLFFEAAGFNGAYLVVDDFERIPNFQSEKLRLEFALEIRTNFFDGILENARIGFYNLLLVLHAGVPRLLEKSWNESGMNRRSPMNNDSHNHVVIFDKLTADHAKLMLNKYLNQYRLGNKSKDSHPFTDNAVEIISEKSDFNASTILGNAYHLIEKAIADEVKLIDREYALNNILELTEDVLQSENKDISEEPSIDLHEKSKNS